MKQKLESRLPGEISITSDMQMTPSLWQKEKSLLMNFPQFLMNHTVKGFGIVNKTEIDVFLELSCFFHDPTDVGNLICGSSAFSKTSLNIWKFGKLSSGHRTGKGQFSLQSQRKAMPKNAQTTARLHSSHTLVK